MALLTPKEAEYFEMKIFENAAQNFLEVKRVSQTFLDVSVTFGNCDKSKTQTLQKSLKMQLMVDRSALKPLFDQPGSNFVVTKTLEVSISVSCHLAPLL